MYWNTFYLRMGARKGLTDTALRTANAGYLTRRLIDVAQDTVTIEEDCGVKEGRTLTIAESEEMGEPLIARITGRVAAADIKDGRKVIVKKGALITEEHTVALEKAQIKEAEIFTALDCLTIRGVCQKCYGYDLGHNKMVEMGTAVGIIAAQSIGEPGTQLTMRTFHTGGVAGADITQGLPRVEELFEARPIKKKAILVEVGGKVKGIDESGPQRVIQVAVKKNVKEVHRITKTMKMGVKEGDKVKAGDVLGTKAKKEVIAGITGKVTITEKELQVFGEAEMIDEYPVPVGYSVWAKKGDLVNAGDQLSEGSLDLHEVFELRGKHAVENYVMKEIQYIYSSQGQKLNDKHVEIILRSMFSRFEVEESGGTELVPGDIVTRDVYREAIEEAKTNGVEEPTAKLKLLGITKASLTTDSFLAAASFQETARVLINAAVTGQVDHLRGLKENVIIGKLIPVGTGYGVDHNAATEDGETETVEEEA